MRHVALTIREADLDEVLDRLLPIVPQGVHQHPPVDGRLELGVYGDAPAARGAGGGGGRGAAGRPRRPRPPTTPTSAGWPRIGRRPPIGGRIVVRPEGAPAGGRACSTSSSTTPAARSARARTRPPCMCLEVLLGLEPGGAFADLGCGTGVLAIVAGKLGWGAADRARPRAGRARTPPTPTRAATASRSTRCRPTCSSSRRRPRRRSPRTCRSTVHERIAARLAPETRAWSSPGSSTTTSAPSAEAYGRRRAAARRPRRCVRSWAAALLVRAVSALLDVAAANAAGAAHGQIASALPDGIALSAHKLVEEGARAQLLILPGVRADRRAAAARRAAGRAAAARRHRARLGDRPGGGDRLRQDGAGDRAAGASCASGSPFWGGDAPLGGPPAGGLHASTTGTGPTHFVGHAVIQQVDADR